jgi:RimJ/RimL family protein N-acetyltransferase
MTSANEAPYPTDLDAHIFLEHDLRLRVRALQCGEEAPIRALDRGLSVRTRYLRFFTPFQSIPDVLVRRLACVDQRNFAIIAEHDRDGGDAIALAGFSAVTEETAEVALMVRDDYQRRGVGTALGEMLLIAAERRGFRRFVASMTTDNLAIRRIVDRCGHVLESATRFGVREIVFVRAGSIQASSDRDRAS